MSTSTKTPNSLPSWPPEVTEEQRAHLVNLSTTYALSHGFTLLPPNSTTPPTHTISAPLSLFPTPFPKTLYDFVVKLQPIYNLLYARIALDWEFLDEVMGSVSEVDDFQGELWRGWKKIRQELVQPIQLGLFRSDYLLHDEPDKPLEIKQVEFNTIAASFGALSQRAGEMHRYLAASTESYFGSSPHLAKESALPHNESLKHLAAGLAEGWKAYGKKDAAILFVVQDGERNVFDQRWLEYELLESHGIRVIRHSFADLSDLAQVDRSGKTLLIPSPLTPNSAPTEIAVIYYRSAYTPTDYPSSSEWQTRILLESSKAIKCPSMALQLAGAKKVQQVLSSQPHLLEDLLLNPERPNLGADLKITEKDIEDLRKTWIGLWPMDESILGREALELAMTQSERFVLKPQREGGGNNIYKKDIPPFLKDLSKQGNHAKEGYILMELIKPPPGLHNWLLKGGETSARDADVVSELGVYGVALFGGKDESKGVNLRAGTLLRTKGRESDEGGVAIGISSIDSPLLI